MTRGGTVFRSYYKLGDDDDPFNPSDPYDQCGQYYLGGAPGHDMSAQGTQSCAQQGEVWIANIRRYYFDNATQPGHVMLLDDAPGVTEYNGGLYVFAVNKARAAGHGWWRCLIHYLQPNYSELGRLVHTPGLLALDTMHQRTGRDGPGEQSALGDVPRHDRQHNGTALERQGLDHQLARPRRREC
jgi:hypothetical protein